MPTLRKAPGYHFTMVDNDLIYDTRVSPKARFIFIFMISKPDNWKFNYKNFEKEIGIGERSIRSGLKELINHGYLKMTRYRNENNVFDWNYTIFPEPILDIPKDKKVECGYNVHIQNECIQNSHNIINTDINNSDKLDKENLNPIFKREEHNFLTNLLIDKGYIKTSDYDLNKYDKLFNKYLSDNYSYNDLSTIASYIVSKVKERNFEDEDFNPIQNKFGYFKASMDSNINQLLKPKEQIISDDILDYDWLNDDHDER